MPDAFKFIPGQVVQMKSGSPIMTVVQRSTVAPNQYYVEWFDETVKGSLVSEESLEEYPIVNG